MKACVATGSDPTNPEKFLAYMVPSPDEVRFYFIQSSNITHAYQHFSSERVFSYYSAAIIFLLCYGNRYQRICMMRMRISHILGFASIIGM